MCCQDSKPIFKGVVISTAIVAFIFVTFIPSPSSSISIDRSTKSLLPQQNTSSSLSKPYCVYLEGSQELDCLCNDNLEAGSHRDSAPVPFPGSEYLSVAGENKSVASVKLHSCKSLHLRLDLRPLARPFYRLRFEDLESITVEGITLVPEDMVDIWFRNVNASVEIHGGLTCFGCKENQRRPRLNLQILEVREVTFEGVDSEGEVDLRVDVRNVDNFAVKESLFRSLEKDALEVYNLPTVTLDSSEFRNATNGSISLKKVTNFNVTSSILERSAVTSDNDVKMGWKCSASPMSTLEVLGEGCLQTPGRTETRWASPPGTGGSVGAIVLAVVSGVLLLVAVTILVFLHKSGKLDQYL